MKLLRHQPWLKPIHSFNINERIHNQTNGDMVVVFNMLKNQIEIHSRYSYKGNQHSFNSKIPEEYVNGYLTRDIKASNLRANLDYFKNQRAEQEYLWDKYEDTQLKNDVSTKLRAVERALGRRL